MEVRPFDSPWWTLRRSADYRGRSTRTELLHFALLVIVAGFAVSFLTAFTRYDSDEKLDTFLLAAVLVPLAALLVRRLHDQARSGWWLLAGAPALAAILMERWQRHSDWGAGLFGRDWTAFEIAGGLSAVAVLILALLPADDAASRYGPDPRQGAEGAAG